MSLKEKVVDSLGLIAFAMVCFTVVILLSLMVRASVPYFVWVILGVGFISVFLLSVKLRR
jgi:FtsH-binding integral membrane protein